MKGKVILALAATAVAVARLSFVASPLDRHEGACAWTVGLSAPGFRLAMLAIVLAAMSVVFLAGRRKTWAAVAAAAIGLATLPVGLRGRHPLTETVAVGAWIREHTTTADTIAVFGSEPEIYVYAGRHAATGRLFMGPLMRDEPGARNGRESMFAEIEAARPAIVVAVNDRSSWPLPEGAVNPVLSWLEGYLALDYEQVGLVEIGDGASKPLWGEDAAGTIPGTESYLLVYRRKPNV